uniref:E3 ubiquitin-protein ligase DTX3L isoform X1 n=1 Tax=Monopterus albus TaxID=43700 RepID=UPI0009B49252|nr:E3 ubiquitin-protein ligase DTX3L-like isoform X1 [Monopterus albus]XP_020446309.1 E3 ubiquitin-protein ligase DTX3L-like isoform X1 [Monopterus albus]
MAEPGRTVRVSGLPSDTDDDKLKDKLFIHFLRTRNGGGEIETVTIVKATPGSALITFEDSGVAQSVIQHGRHILEVDGKKYKLTVTEHHKSLDPDKVILSLSATVDYRQLPGGKPALTSLHMSHPEVQINYDVTKKFYILCGAYSKVQAALAQLLGHSGGQQSAENKGSRQSVLSGFQPDQKPHTQESEDQSKKPNKQREQRGRAHTGTTYDDYSLRTPRDLTPSGWEDTGRTEGAAVELPGRPSESEEDFSLIVDADMFQYLQRHCQKEYQHILSQYGVEVVDMTNQGLTTLFLQVATGVDGVGREHLNLAKKAISRLYQENEAKTRRAQLPKCILSRDGLQRAMENLSVRLPKLLLNEDDRYIYIIGNSGDVSEAKQFLLLDHSQVRSKKEDVYSLLRYPSYDLSSSSPADEERVSITTFSPEGSPDERIDHMLMSDEDERKADGARRYKLAARFKDSGLAALSSRPTDLRGVFSPSRQTRLGPVLGHDVLSDKAGISGERASTALAQNTGGDILFKSGDTLPSSAFMQKKTSLNSNVMDTRPKNLTSPLSTTQSSLSGSTTPPSVSGSPLKRASSFSGTPQQKAQVMGHKSQDDYSKSTVRARGRSTSFSTQTGKDKREVYNGEIRVSSVMWQYIKEAYRTRVDDLTSDVQMKESHPEGSADVTVSLRGADSSTVSSCQLNLQKLVDSVNTDFSVQELCLSELGITDPANETLQACCDEVRSRFKKVSIQILKKRLYLLGPKVLCSQVDAVLREVFSGDMTKIPEQQAFSSTSISNRNLATLSQMNDDQITSVHCNSNPQVMLESQTAKASETGSGQERKTNHRSDFHETELVNGSINQTLVSKDPVIKEKVKMIGTLEMDGHKTETFVNHSTIGSDRSARRVNGVGSTTTHTDKDVSLHKNERTIHSTPKDSIQRKTAEIQNSPRESRSGHGDLGGICVCGETGTSIIRTKCGVSMCSKCLDTVHFHCRVCHETELTPQGIQGKMSYSKLNISVPGHKKDSAVKITYLIPDGIQVEGHPSPGKPFQGGIFEAYLPDCEKSRKLLPRLDRAFRQGLTFTVTGKETGAKVAWDCIPHKTSIHGGKSGNGYPDSTYLDRLSVALTHHGI